MDSELPASDASTDGGDAKGTDGGTNDALLEEDVRGDGSPSDEARE
jgi:hypothetical protein